MERIIKLNERQLFIIHSIINNADHLSSEDWEGLKELISNTIYSKITLYPKEFYINIDSNQIFKHDSDEVSYIKGNIKHLSHQEVYEIGYKQCTQNISSVITHNNFGIRQAKIMELLNYGKNKEIKIKS
jgi:hypothetical protein